MLFHLHPALVKRLGDKQPPILHCLKKSYTTKPNAVKLMSMKLIVFRFWKWTPNYLLMSQFNWNQLRYEASGQRGLHRLCTPSGSAISNGTVGRSTYKSVNFSKILTETTGPNARNLIWILMEHVWVFTCARHCDWPNGGGVKRRLLFWQ